MLKTSTQKRSSTYYYLCLLSLGILLTTQTSCTNSSQLNFDKTEQENPSQGSNLSQNCRKSRGKRLLNYLLRITSASQLNEERIEDLLANEQLTTEEKVKAFKAMERKLKKGKPVKQLAQVLSKPAECDEAAVEVILTSQLADAAQVKALKWISIQLPQKDKQMAQILDNLIHKTLPTAGFSVNHKRKGHKYSHFEKTNACPKKDALIRRAYAVRKQFCNQSSHLNLLQLVLADPHNNLALLHKDQQLALLHKSQQFNKEDLLQLVFANPSNNLALLDADQRFNELEKYLVTYVIKHQLAFPEVTERSPRLLFKRIKPDETQAPYARESDIKALRIKRVKSTQRDHFIRDLAHKKYGYPLHVAIVYGIPDEALLGLLEIGADATYSDKKYGYPLHAAIAHKRSVEVLQELVNQGADVTHGDPKHKKNSPLATALKHQNTAAVEFLLPYLGKCLVEEREKAYQILLPHIKSGQTWSGRAYTDWLLGECFEEALIRKQLQISKPAAERSIWEVENEKETDSSLEGYFAKRRQEDSNDSYKDEYESIYSDASSTGKKDSDTESDTGSIFTSLSDEESDQED